MRRANELQLVTETLKGHKVSEEQLVLLQEKFSPNWEKYNIYLDLTDVHFVEQLSRIENRHNPISLVELESLLNKFTEAHIKEVSLLDHNSYGVIKEPNICTNLVFFVDCNSKVGKEKDIRLITIMRKKDFKTHNTVYKIELE